MSRQLRGAVVRRETAGLMRGAAALLVAASLAGCSADVTRFSGGFGLTETPPNTRRTPSRPVTSEVPLSQTGGSYAGGYGGYDAPPPISDRGGITVAALPDATPPPAPSSYEPPRAAPAPIAPAPIARATPPAPAMQAAARPSALGATIEVQQGDTISSLARRHNVPISDLMAANNLRSPAIHPGQQLILPASAKPRPPLSRSASTPVRPSAASPSPAVASGDWSGSHTVKNGESLYGIARQHGVKAEDLQRANGISDVHKVRPGTVLRVPAAAGEAVVAEAPKAAVAPVRPAPVAPARIEPLASESARSEPPKTAQVEPLKGVVEPIRPRVLNGQVAAAPAVTATDATPEAPAKESAAAAPAKAVAGTKLRWPVRGKVIAGFGRLTDGTHNDGINIQVPAGTDVLAAEAGVVAYAGSEVKGYGNLVLVRHDNGWITAYAHNDSILVQRGDRVRRGQPVGKAGKSGSVDQPQVHFEVRDGSKPIDPMPHMERL